MISLICCVGEGDSISRDFSGPQVLPLKAPGSHPHPHFYSPLNHLGQDKLKFYILRQVKEDLNIKIFLCPSAPSLPALCMVYPRYALTKPSPSAEIPAQP